jgi:hypothetical protein
MDNQGDSVAPHRDDLELRLYILQGPGNEAEIYLAAGGQLVAQL